MSVVITNDDLKNELPINWSFEITNGLLGIERDTFLLLIGYVHFDHNDNKTRNVWMFSIFFKQLSFFINVVIFILYDLQYLFNWCIDDGN
jgi:hypothetical protein